MSHIQVTSTHYVTASTMTDLINQQNQAYHINFGNNKDYIQLTCKILVV